MRKPSEKKIAEYRKRYVGRLAQGKRYKESIALALDVWYEHDTFWIKYYLFIDERDFVVTLSNFKSDVVWLTGPLVTP